jgi:hypothetical protein
MDLLAAARGGQAPQGAPQAAPQQGQPQQPGANPLAALMAQQQQQQQQPAPTHAQTVAAIHRFGEIKSALQPVLSDPNLGKSNIRPKLLDAASKLLGAKVLSLPEIMNKIKGLPDDPIQQKNFVEGIIDTANKAEAAVLQHHLNAPPEPDGTDPWSRDNQQQHIDGLMKHYGGRNG